MIARIAYTRLVRNAARYVTALGIAVSVESCKETTGPITPETPTGVTAVLVSSTSVKVTWTPASDPSSIRSYNVFRNGTKVGEVSGPLFVDTGLAERATYRYGASANGVNGLVSGTSEDTPANVISIADATPPALATTTPSNAASGVDRATKITATFSETLDATTAVAANFNVSIAGGAAIPGSVTYLPATNTIEFTPTSALPSATTISVSISTGIKDAAGNPMASAATFSFTTRDDVPPSVVSTTIPAAGEVPLSQVISATMSEAIDASTLTPSTVRLGAAAAIPGTISYDAPSRTITFSPTGGLSGATDYAFIVGPGIRDLAGNASTTAFTRTFRTVDVTAPAVTAVTPANQAASVATSTPVNVVFSRDMDASTLTTTSLTLRLTSSGAFVPGSVAYDAASRTASYVPSNPLAFGTAYTIAVSNTVRASNGVTLAQNFVSTFTTVQIADVTPPGVILVVPSSGATDVSASTSVTIKFSEPLDPASVTSAAVTVSGTGVGGVSGAISYDAAASTVTFVPTSSLQNDVIYTVTVSTAIRDVAGNPLANAFTSSFRTSAAPPPPDVTSPTVLSSVPAHGSTNVDINTPVRINFSEAMNAAKVNGSTIFLTAPGGATVPGVVSYDNATFSATFVPNAALLNGTTYTLVAGTGLTDVAGNSLTAPFSAAFTTVAALPPADTTPPTVVATVPSNGSTEVFVTSPIIVTFSEAMTASTINTATITVAVVGIPISGSVVYDAASRTATFVSSAGLLAEGKDYTVTVSTGVKDASGNALASTFTYSFKTQDLTPPLVVSRSPDRGATNVATNSTIRFGFSEEMIPSTINNSTVTLSSGGTPVAGTVSYDVNAQVATFTPSSALANNQLYMAIVTKGAKDLSGNGLYYADTTTFTTAPAAPGFDIGGSTGFLGWWGATTAGSVGIHFHIVFDQNGSTLTRSPSNCDSGGKDACITLAQNEAGRDAIGPNSPGFVWVLVPSAGGVLSGNQISFTMTNANGRTFTFNGAVNSPYQMVGTISGHTLPAEVLAFTRPVPP